MKDVLVWLRSEAGGISTYIEFRKRMLALIESEPEHAALARMLSVLAAKFVDKYYGEPLTTDTSQAAMGRLIGFIEGMENLSPSNPKKYLNYLNKIALEDLL